MSVTISQKSDKFKTKEKLSAVVCDREFRNMLRSHDINIRRPDVKIVPFHDFNPSRYKNKESHIFFKESEKPEKTKPQKDYFHIQDQVMFNDYYVSKRPNKFNKGPKLGYKNTQNTNFRIFGIPGGVENKMKIGRKNVEISKTIDYNNNERFESAGIKGENMFWHSRNIPSAKQKRMQVLITNLYKRNPMKIMNDEETQKFNEELKEKAGKRFGAYKRVYSSENLKKSLEASTRNADSTIKEGKTMNDKITNNNFYITQRASRINRVSRNKENPNYEKRHYQVMSCGNGVYKYI